MTSWMHVLAAIHTLNRLECIGETLRHALNTLAIVALDWLRRQVPADWFERYGRRFEEYRLPPGRPERYALAETMGADGLHLLTALYASETPPWLREVPAVEVLRQVWVQQFAVVDDVLRWRKAENQTTAQDDCRSSVSLMQQAEFDPLPTLHGALAEVWADCNGGSSSRPR